MNSFGNSPLSDAAQVVVQLWRPMATWSLRPSRPLWPYYERVHVADAPPEEDW